MPASDPTKPIGPTKTAWKTAKKLAGWILAGRLEERDDVTPLECRFHDLRHTAASRMLKAKVPITTVAKILGWSASTMVAMAKRYSHYLVDDLRDAMEQASDPDSENTAQFTAHRNRPTAAEGGNVGIETFDVTN